MIKVRYLGRLGNNLFQYCFGRILAEKMGYKLNVMPIPGFPGTNVPVEGRDYSASLKEPLTVRGQIVDIENLANDKDARKIILDGYFQRYAYYRPYKEKIRNQWLKIEPSRDTAVRPGDVVIIARRRKMVSVGSATPFSYYREALDKCRHERVFICTDAPEDPFFILFWKYRPIMVSPDPIGNLRFILNFKKIILSCTTFGWWAAFLSQAKEIYYPVHLNGLWSPQRPDIDLTVDDEDRYIYLKCREMCKFTLIDKTLLWMREILGKPNR